MWTYILRRVLLILPTMFGVTVVSFGIMQFAPGDPELISANAGDRKAGQTQDLYLITRRSLFLDKPLLLNTRYFTDYRPALREAAYFLVVEHDALAEDLARWREAPTPADDARRAFVTSLRGRRFDPLVVDLGERLADPDRHRSLAGAMKVAVSSWLADVGPYGVAAALDLLDDPGLTREERVGLTMVLQKLFLEPQKKSYTIGGSLDQARAETVAVETLWRRWRDLRPPGEPVTEARREELEQFVLRLTGWPTLDQMNADLGTRYAFLQGLSAADRVALVDLLLASDNLRVKQVVATILAGVVSSPLTLVASEKTGEADLATIVENWKTLAAARRAEFDYDLPTKIGGFFFDTQYARMAGRLVSFQFGQSATRSREDVSKKLADAAAESVPLMLAAELVIYLLAIPLGILCGVRRGTVTDRGVSAGLFLLYSIPPSVFAMLVLMTFCYPNETFPTIFPNARLHGDDAERLALGPYLLDFAWHAVLPVACLSLFSLASMAMYSRSSILDVLGQDYIRTARAKGLSPLWVIGKHAFRNSLIPILTLFSNFLPALLGGSVIIEVLFDINGLGKLGWDSITQKDFPTQMALLYISALVVMLSILMTDLLYVVADPRIDLDRRE